MMRNSLVMLIALCFSNSNWAQISDSSFVAIDSVSIDTVNVMLPTNHIQNAVAIAAFYSKLSNLEAQKNRKINIVHIGDSHIQADLMTAKVRRMLQQRFDNGGRGFVFPHNLAKTNGSSDVRFSSSGSWESYRNIYPPNGSAVGLSGIALAAKSADFAVEFNAKEPDNAFSSIRIITPDNNRHFDLATERKITIIEKAIPKKITHKIRSGEALSIIADKYNVSIVALKKANGLKSNNIRAGKTLRIPTTQLQPVTSEIYEYVPLPMHTDAISNFYNFEKLVDKIYIIPSADTGTKQLNGLVLGNDQSGILYHNIGVNSAKLSDYNKYPLFFSQLKALTPDLVVVSLGTNESFDKITAEEYMTQLNLFIANLRSQDPNVNILVMTPPPSMFQRRYPNTFAAAYSKSIIELAAANSYSVWDMYSQLGGLFGVNRNAKNGIIGSDRVHYTKAGYEAKASLFVEALLHSFSDFKNNGK